jgi:hypothetical protein
MKREKIAARIPAALYDLHEAGRPWVYGGEIVDQINRTDRPYQIYKFLSRKALGLFGINLPESPPYERISPSRLQDRLWQLETDGIVACAQEPGIEAADIKLTVYWLNDPPREEEMFIDDIV